MVIYKIALLCRDVLNCRIAEHSWNAIFGFPSEGNFLAGSYSIFADRGAHAVVRVDYLVPIDSDR